MTKHLVVVGGGQGGLVAAIYARLKGHSVLLLEQSGQVGGKAGSIDVQGFRLDPGPSIIILPRIYESVFNDAGRKMSDYLTFERLDPISRVLFEEQPPVDLPSDRAACERLVAEIAPQDGKAFTKMMQILDKVAPHVDRSVFRHPFDKSWQLADPHLIAMALQFDVRISYKQLVDRWFQSPLLRAFFYGFPSYGGQSYLSKAPGALMIPYLMLQEGVFYPKGGVGAIPLAFRSLAEELGIEIRTSTRVTGLEYSNQSINSVRLADGELISTDAVISNVDRSTTKTWLGESTTVPPSFSYFTVHWGISRRIEGLSHHTLLIPWDFEEGFSSLYQDKRFPASPIIYLNDTTDRDPTVAPPGCTNLFAVVTSPACEPEIDWIGNERKYRNVVAQSLGRFGIQISESDIVFERVQTPKYFEVEHGNYRGSLYGVDESHRPFGGMFPHRNRDDKFTNLFYCGGSVQPGAGLPMVTLSGRFAAQML